MIQDDDIAVATPYSEKFHFSVARGFDWGASWCGIVDTFVGAMRVQAAAVNLVTSDGPGGKTGVTVSAMTAVSAEPPYRAAYPCSFSIFSDRNSSRARLS